MNRFKNTTLSLIVVFSLSNILCGCQTQNEKKARLPELSQMSSICNLATLDCYYHNVAKSIKPAATGITHIGEKDRKFWIEYTGVVQLGIDASKLQMSIDGNQITIKIPKAQILRTSIDEINEDSFMFSSDGWNKNEITASDQTAAISNAQTEMEKTAAQNVALLQKAQNRAKDLITNYIHQLGLVTGTEYTIVWSSAE